METKLVGSCPAGQKPGSFLNWSIVGWSARGLIERQITSKHQMVSTFQELTGQTGIMGLMNAHLYILYCANTYNRHEEQICYTNLSS